LGALLQAANTQLAEDISQTQADLRSATNTARLTMIGALLALTLTMCIASFYVSRVIQKAFLSGEAEREALRSAKATLQFRNDQLNALYNVFSEITDTLSMRYVISATLRETLRVMNATMVTVRLLRGSQLVVAGNLTNLGREIPDMPPVPLGEGPTGRVARRGRSMRVNQGAQALLGPSIDPDDANSGVESGIIVPLIVGARVVGTLACWSKEPNAYTEEDERILEMMASQVATAVIAADQTETSERRAMLDPLTNLPNRRQLNADIAETLSSWPSESRHAVVAMIDIDHFKHLNDDFGHRVGDVTLQKVASVMRHSIRDSDRIYRYGGEEFVVIFADAHAAEAQLLAERLRKAVAETPLSGDKLEPVGPVTISIGLSLMPEHGTDFNSLIELADRAMYRAKDAGRNRILTWRADSSESVSLDAVA
jgi:diguanylate cyclase (GGDEF)-like protein